MRVLLFGMKQIYLMPFGDQRAQGLFLWNTIHLRYHKLQAHNLTSYVLFSSKIHYDYILKDSIKSVIFLFPYKLPINMKAFFSPRHWSTMALFMHMLSLHVLDIHQTQVILSTSLLLLLEGHTVRFCPCTSDLSFFSLFDDILVETNPDVSISSFSTIPAVVAYLPKSKTDKRKSLLGDSKDSEGEVVSQVSSWLFVICKVNWRWIFHWWVLSKRISIFLIVNVIWYAWIW